MLRTQDYKKVIRKLNQISKQLDEVKKVVLEKKILEENNADEVIKRAKLRAIEMAKTMNRAEIEKFYKKTITKIKKQLNVK
jgi:hypothetical protein